MCEPSNHCYECEIRFSCLQLSDKFEVPEARVRRQANVPKVSTGKVEREPEDKIIKFEERQATVRWHN